MPSPDVGGNYIWHFTYEKRIEYATKNHEPYLKMKLSFLFILLFQQPSFGQLSIGTYVSQSDTTQYIPDTNSYKIKAIVEFVSYPNLEIRNDHTFKFNWSYPRSCIMGSTLGTWNVEEGKLFLKDSIYTALGVGGVRPDRIDSLNNVTVYIVDNLKLTFLYEKNDKYYSERVNSLRDFRFYKE